VENSALTSQQDVCALEGISEHVEITRGKDEGEGRGEGDGGGTGVFPLRRLALPIGGGREPTHAQQSVEHGVVVWMIG
jgi:hypothetical protein